ncbi:MAG: hypothetical protein KBD90_01105 [Alphaproteobacteria bacterium]|nr:hypothetical protein [Alphaproteobacteria bacterium]
MKKRDDRKNKAFIGIIGGTQPFNHRFLRLVDRLESDMVRLQVTVADLKVGYYALVSGLKTTVSTL